MEDDILCHLGMEVIVFDIPKWNYAGLCNDRLATWISCWSQTLCGCMWKDTESGESVIPANLFCYCVSVILSLFISFHLPPELIVPINYESTVI